MKLNPFSKKTTSGYYARIKVEYADVKQQLDTLQAAAAEAKADCEAKEKYAFDLEQRGSHHSVSEAERRARREAGESKLRADALERDVRDLKAKFHDLRSIVEAPGKLESVRATIIELRRRRGALQTEREQHAKLIAKLDKRIGELGQRVAAETQSASEAMAAAEGEFALPETLTKLDVELRVARATLENVNGKLQALDAEIAAIPGQISEAERAFKHHQSSVAKIELHEQLPQVYDVLARAAVAARNAGFSTHSERKLEIEIPHEYLEAARAKLAAERPSA